MDAASIPTLLALVSRDHLLSTARTQTDFPIGTRVLVTTGATMTRPVPYSELHTQTKERRRNAALREPAKTKERINDIVMRATHDNPVSIMMLSKCTDFARHCLMLGASDNDAVEAVRKYIMQLNSIPVG